MSGVAVVAGHVQALRLFDVAYAIDLARAEALWSAHAAGPAWRRRLSTTPPKAMAFSEPPLAIDLDTVILTLPGGSVEAGVTARLYDFGAVSLALKVPASGMAWDEYADFANAVDALLASAAGMAIWDGLLARLRAAVLLALERPSPSTVTEEYLICVVSAFDGQPAGVDLPEQLDLVRLMSGERRQLSVPARAELLRQRFSYYADDLVVLTWDRAFLYEPRGDSDVSDVLEVANAQLLEMRYYDELLDAELPRMYDLVEGARRGWNVMAPRRYAGLARRLYTMVAEVTELTEKVDNALQVTEDVYLARVYAAALDSFKVASVTAAVNRKLAIIRDTYAALHDEAAGARSSFVEIAILVLIAVEILLALVRH